MLYHVRFLKVPSARRGNKGYNVKCVLSLTNDLGDEFFYGDCDIEIAVGQNRPGIVKWKPGMRSVSYEQEIPMSKIKGPVVVRARVLENTVKDHLQDVENHAENGFFPLSSEPLSIAKDMTISEKRAVREINYKKAGISLKMVEETGESIAKHLWDGAIIGMYELLEDDPVGLPKQPRHILELGAGCGLIGIGFAQLYKRSNVVLTDLDDAEEICKYNIKLNQVPNAKFKEFDWNEDDQEVTSVNWDLVLTTDCIYNDDSYAALIGALTRVAKPSTRFVMGHKHRHQDEAKFFTQLNEKFTITNDKTLTRFGQPIRLIEFKLK